MVICRSTSAIRVTRNPISGWQAVVFYPLMNWNFLYALHIRYHPRFGRNRNTVSDHTYQDIRNQPDNWFVTTSLIYIGVNRGSIKLSQLHLKKPVIFRSFYIQSEQ